MGKEMTDIGQEFHERWVEFSQSFGNDGFFEDGIIEAMRSMATLCEIFFGEKPASLGFNTIVRGAFPERQAEEPWERILDDEFSAIHSETPIGNLLHDLSAYAGFGIVVAVAREEPGREIVLRNQILKAQTLLQLLPIAQWKLEGEHLVKLLNKSIARWKVDTGEPLDATELALLSGRARQTIKNKLSGAYAEIVGTERHIEAREAAAWLAVQKDFKTSIWREQQNWTEPAEIQTGFEEVFFLPVAKDGSVFHPGVCRNGKYLIDEEGHERALGSFEDALASLQVMVFPQWRRPTAEGVWTRVRAVEWRRYSIREAIDMAAESQPKPPK